MVMIIQVLDYTIKRINKGLKPLIHKCHCLFYYTIKRINKGLKPPGLSIVVVPIIP